MRALSMEKRRQQMRRTKACRPPFLSKVCTNFEALHLISGLSTNVLKSQYNIVCCSSNPLFFLTPEVIFGVEASPRLMRTFRVVS